ERRGDHPVDGEDEHHEHDHRGDVGRDRPAPAAHRPTGHSSSSPTRTIDRTYQIVAARVISTITTAAAEATPNRLAPKPSVYVYRLISSVLRSGPPRVITYTWVNTLRSQ